MLNLHIACDHAGFELKEAVKSKLHEELTALGLTIVDHGTNSSESCDYPLFANAACQAVTAEKSVGLLICGTGIGMSMVANRHQGIRAALCTTELHAKLARRHNNANVLCLGARMTGSELAKAIILAFFAEHFEGGRHQRRIDLFSK
ncbi:MAG: ribose 5-phosphate isomerase B [Desulfovibrio sp.]|nr:ribose 5-phosphate isomerase B [Desulfovibrio sp.]